MTGARRATQAAHAFRFGAQTSRRRRKGERAFCLIDRRDGSTRRPPSEGRPVEEPEMEMMFVVRRGHLFATSESHLRTPERLH